LDRTALATDTRDLSQHAKENPLLIALFANAKGKGFQPASVQATVTRVDNEATNYVVIVDVINRGDGDSGSVIVRIPNEVDLDEQVGSWHKKGDAQVVDYLRPAETARLVLRSGKPINLSSNDVTLHNSRGVVAE